LLQPQRAGSAGAWDALTSLPGDGLGDPGLGDLVVEWKRTVGQTSLRDRGMSLLWFQRNPLPTDWAAQRQILARFDA
jgi:hypothetical protein